MIRLWKIRLCNVVIIVQDSILRDIILHFFCSVRSVDEIIEKTYTVQSTLVISKSRGPSETLRDIRTSTYQMCRTE